MRALGVDVGEQRIGLAVSDRSGFLSAPHGTLRRDRDAARAIAALASDLEAEVIVVGLPLTMRGGGEGPQAAAVRLFADEVAAATTLPIEFYDERLTTVMAERALLARGDRRDKRRQQIDAVAASIILQGWLDHRRLAAARADEAW